jgi:hypothetical protein
MSPDAEQEGVVSPDDAFGVLGNEIRIQILQVLGEAEESMSFTELRDRVGLPQGGQFNYHLEKIVGHFVKKTDEGYVLRQPGRRVVQAVLSGAVTDDPELDYTEIDKACWWCGAPMVVRFRQERLELYCTGCEGLYEGQSTRRPTPLAVDHSTGHPDLGFLGTLFMPPAGVQDRTPEEIFRIALAREITDYLAIAGGFCSRCSGPIDKSVTVCEHHDVSDGLCNECENRLAVHLHVRCQNCNFQRQGVFGHTLYFQREVLAFFMNNGASLLSTDSHFFREAPYEEEIISTDPFEAKFIFTVGDETLTVTADDTFSVVDTVRS